MVYSENEWTKQGRRSGVCTPHTHYMCSYYYIYVHDIKLRKRGDKDI